MDELYRKLFKDKYIYRLVFDNVKRLQRRCNINNSLKYADIVDIEWMIKNRYYGILAEKLKSNQTLSIDLNPHLHVVNVIYTVQDSKCFITLFERYKKYLWKKTMSQPWNETQLIKEVITHNNYDAIRYFYQLGYTPKDLILQLSHQIKPRVLKLLLVLGWYKITAETIFDITFKYSQETCDIIKQYAPPSGFNGKESSDIIRKLVATRSQLLFKTLYPLFEQPVNLKFPMTSTFKIQDPDLFIYLCHTLKFSDTQVTDLILDNTGYADSIGILKYGKDLYSESFLDLLLAKALYLNSLSWIEYILKEFPQQSLKKVEFSLNRYKNPQHIFQSLELIKLLLDKGLSIDSSWLDAPTNVFIYLWKRFKGVVEVDTPSTIIYIEENKRVIVNNSVFNTCFKRMDITLLDFLIQEGFTEFKLDPWITYGENVWKFINFDKPKSFEFLKKVLMYLKNSVREYRLVLEKCVEGPVEIFDYVCQIPECQNILDSETKVFLLKLAIQRGNIDVAGYMCDIQPTLVQELISSTYLTSSEIILESAKVELIQILLEKMNDPKVLKELLETDCFLIKVIKNNNCKLLEYLLTNYKYLSMSSFIETILQSFNPLTIELLMTNPSSFLSPPSESFYKSIYNQAFTIDNHVIVDYLWSSNILFNKVVAGGHS